MLRIAHMGYMREKRSDVLRKEKWRRSDKVDSLIDQKKLSDMIGRIYDAGHQPELWIEVFAEIDALTQTEAERTNQHHPIVNLLQPHLFRAIEMSETMHSQKDKHAALTHTMNHLPIGVITVDEEGNIQNINDYAEQLLENNNLVYVQQNKLRTSTSSETAKLLANIHQANKGLQQTMTLSNESSFTLHFMPAAQQNTNIETKVVNILITCGHTQPAFCAEDLASFFKLTPSEGKLLCALLGKNHSLTEAATTLGISKHTARAQIKSIFTKTETCSQSELLKKVFSHFSSQAYMQHHGLEQQSQSPQTHALNEFHTITLNDGRCLEYTEYGDPEGMPILYFHGIIHSRQQFHPFSDYVDTHDIRIIAPERPGFGATSRQNNTSLTGFATDIKQLTNHLQLERFYVLGEGNGGASALACAAVLSKQVIGSAIVACVPDKQFDQIKALNPFERQLYNIKQRSSKALSFTLAKTVLKMLSKHDRLLLLMSEHYYHTDRALMQSPAYRKMYQESMRNALPSNSKGFVEDYFARTNNWDFQIQNITAPVHIWHGDSDSYVNIKSAEKIAKSIPNCITHFLKDQGHYIFFSHIDDILKHLIRDSA